MLHLGIHNIASLTLAGRNARHLQVSKNTTLQYDRPAARTQRQHPSNRANTPLNQRDMTTSDDRTQDISLELKVKATVSAVPVVV
jgi:hypothetical protein